MRGLVGYHGTRRFADVLRDGLDPARGVIAPHVCVAADPSVAASFGTVLVVRLDELELPQEGFHNGELRLHDPVEPGRLSVLEPQPRPSLAGFVDPITYPGGNHPTCLRLRCWARRRKEEA